jgi:hypothetical protein
VSFGFFFNGAIMELNLDNGSYLIALLISVAISLVLMVALNQPLRRYLSRASNSLERSEFLTRYFKSSWSFCPLSRLR